MVEETEGKIQSDISGLYKKLHKEETKSLLCRLEEEPLDITNLVDLLLARSLSDEGFYILKRAFTKILSSEVDIDNESNLKSEREQYTLLFFQHYMYLSMLDSVIRPEVVKAFEVSMNSAFKRDIIKSTEDFCKVLSINDTSFAKVSLLVDYLKALNKSKYSNMVELKNIFQEKVNNDILVEAIEKCSIDEIYLGLFGVVAPEKTVEANKTADNAREVKEGEENNK